MGRKATTENRAPAAREPQNQSCPFLPTALGATGWVSRRLEKVGVNTMRMVKFTRKMPKPMRPTKFMASFIFQTWLVEAMGLGAPRACSKNSMVYRVDWALKWDQGWMMAGR